jgi:hypothetical protein
MEGCEKIKAVLKKINTAENKLAFSILAENGNTLCLMIIRKT